MSAGKVQWRSEVLGASDGSLEDGAPEICRVQKLHTIFLWWAGSLFRAAEKPEKSKIPERQRGGPQKKWGDHRKIGAESRCCRAQQRVFGGPDLGSSPGSSAGFDRAMTGRVRVGLLVRLAQAAGADVRVDLR